MHCNCCDALLTDYEATRRHGLTQEFLDLCSTCFRSISKDVSIPHRDRPELWGENDSEEDDEKELDDIEEL